MAALHLCWSVARTGKDNFASEVEWLLSFLQSDHTGGLGDALSNSANGGSGQPASAAAAVHTAPERMIKHSPGTGQRRGGQVSAWPHKPL